ncbi:MAG: hypothetical protein IPL53_17490 [Ignavibacteria bacterium]|nr:hypothetical protein [Ignavibacteria bacterium]
MVTNAISRLTFDVSRLTFDVSRLTYKRFRRSGRVTPRLYFNGRKAFKGRTLPWKRSRSQSPPLMFLPVIFYTSYNFNLAYIASSHPSKILF